MYPFIPEEILVNILQYLPANSLLRFKCVSKQWCQLVSGIKNERQKFVMKSVSEEGDYSFQMIDRTTCQVQNMDMPWKSEQAEIYCHGSCNGLLLVEFINDLFLWNPFIRFHQKILSYKGLSSYKKVSGLCFDSIRNEYRIVMHLSDSHVKFAMVGSPINKSWTHIDFPYWAGSLHSGPVFNNRLHWFATKQGFPLFPDLIIYFDTEADGFAELPIPPPQEGVYQVIVGLGVLDGCLCMSHSDGIYRDTIQVMAMKEYGVRESWTTLFIIEGIHFGFSFKPIFYCDNEKSEVLIKVEQDISDPIILYNVNTKSRSDVNIVYSSQHETLYEESVDRPSLSDWEELDLKSEASYVEKFLSGYTRTVKKDDNGSWCVDKEEGPPTRVEESEEEDEESDDSEQSGED